MSSVGFSYAHVHVQQERLKEKLRRSNNQEQERGKDAANKRSNKTKKIHPTLNSEKNSSGDPTTIKNNKKEEKM